jgi:glucosyl-3-phosphoglycerate phosphatase
MTRLIVWRHGLTDSNASSRVQGQLDIPLNAVGRSQAAAAAGVLAGFHPDAVISSDLSRSSETAAALSAVTGLPVSYDARLRERHFGLWQGLLLSEIEARYPTEYAAWRVGSPSPGCAVESLDDMGKRVGEAFQEAADSVPGGTIVVVSHGGSARQGCGHLLGWPASVLVKIRGLHNCHWTELRHDGVRGWQLRAHNVGA